MVQEEFTTTIIKSEEGKFLTQKGTVNIKDRIISNVIALGKYDSADNYKEITSEKADEYLKKKEEAIKAEIEKAGNN